MRMTFMGGIGYGFLRGDLQESHVVRVAQEREQNAAGYQTKPRIYEMANGDFLEVVWSGEDKHVCFNAHVPLWVGFKSQDGAR